jgi:hypothetical protein
VQGAFTHWFVAAHDRPLGQSRECRHATQFPAPSHNMPPPGALHGVPVGLASVPGMPALLHVPTRHGLLGVGTLFRSTTRVGTPHAVVSWQSAGTSMVNVLQAPALAPPAPLALVEPPAPSAPPLLPPANEDLPAMAPEPPSPSANPKPAAPLKPAPPVPALARLIEVRPPVALLPLAEYSYSVALPPQPVSGKRAAARNRHASLTATHRALP